MNLHTAMIMAIKEKTDIKKHHATILKKLDGIMKTIDGLREDPLFINQIHGEQELNLDQSIELFNGIRSKFIPPDAPPELSPGYETNSFDVS
mgnify:CR=1 FL=1|tara:strand:- start:245 stop:520 length:276 start_codon:yes stop_codon:yes gene_type:complete